MATLGPIGVDSSLGGCSNLVSNDSSSNYSTDPWARVGAEFGDIYRTFLAFDLSSIAGTVTAANFQIELTSENGWDDTYDIQFFRCTQNAVEDEMTWNDYASGSAWTAAGGDMDGAVVDAFAWPTGGDIKSFDIINCAKDAVDNRSGNLLMIVKHDGDGDVEQYNLFGSDDYPTVPTLTVTYTADPPSLNVSDVLKLPMLASNPTLPNIT